MFIAEAKRKESLVAYLLYMWQIEDLIRACDLDMSKIESLILPKYNLEGDNLDKLRAWYSELLDMMLIEGIREKGHLNICKIAQMQLESAHRELINNPDEYIYTSLHYQILPALIQLKEKMGGVNISEIEIALNALYGYLTMKLEGKEISEETSKSMQEISNFLSMLVHKQKEIDAKEKENL